MSEKSIGERNYESFAQRYAEHARTKPHNAHYDRPAVLSLLPDVRGKRVLDAGCGPGFYAETLLERGAQVVAFDVTPDMVAIAQERLGERATVLRADLTQPLDFAQDGNFDVVLCPLVLDYIEDWGAVFREFQRVLKPGGVLVFSAGHPLGDWLWIERKLPNPQRRYFERELFTIEWGGFGEPRPAITSYRRSLQDFLNPLLDSGLRLDHILEPQPTDEYRQADPQGYEKLRKLPGFLCVRAMKPAAG